jgi:biopolymer transport protein ExbD
MGKIKLPRTAPSLDMTPMVDLAFLLVTFFILTANFRVNEAVNIIPPSSQSDKILPENMLMVSIDTAGRVFFSMDGQEARRNLLFQLANIYKFQPTEEDAKRFSVMTDYGGPISELIKYIRMDENQRAEFDKKTTGIPMDSANNELANWIFHGYREKQRVDLARDVQKDKRTRIAIKADGRTNYKIIKRVIQVFQDTPPGLNTFNLITESETEKLE